MDAEEGGKKKPDLHRRGVFVAVGCWWKDARRTCLLYCGESLFKLIIIPYIFYSQYKKLQMSSI
jgi:hypothetical protein